jgi:uncharacterized protein (DUF305 family)
MQPFRYLYPLLCAGICLTALSGCQPSADNQPSSATTDPAPPVSGIEESDAVTEQAEVSGSTIVNPDEQVLLGLQADYGKAMEKMDDEMQLMLSINNVDVAFARVMLGHHRGAVDLTKLQQRYGSDDSLRELAATILSTEQDEIDALRKWMASHPDTRSPDPSTTQIRESYHYAISAMNERIRLAINAATPDLIFAQTMLAHHRGAEAIANIQLKYGNDAEMRQLAAQIIEEQRSEIAALEAWLLSQGIDAKPRLVPLTDNAEPLVNGLAADTAAATSTMVESPETTTDGTTLEPELAE